jgi:hypothetical protein
MDWDALEGTIPYVPNPAGEALHTQDTVVLQQSDKIVRVAQPGKYSEKTKGGDFLVQVSDPSARTLAGSSWWGHWFTHVDLFKDFEEKRRVSPDYMRRDFAPALVQVTAEGADPEKAGRALPSSSLPGLTPTVALVASQTLALAEMRRYSKYEPKGGRCLPTRFALGIIFSIWAAADAADVQKGGIRGLWALHLRAARTEPNLEAVLGRKLLASAACSPEAERGH